MIKLFRNTRKKLLSENKTGNYLKYAIGEIGLVVIGILIALQINNWNEGRKDKKLQLNYSKELSNNLEKDIVQLKESIELNNFFDEQSFYFLDYLLNRLEEPDFYRLAKATLNASDLRSHTSNPSVYNDLISTGNLRLYHDPLFKNLLNNYFNNSRENLDRHLENETWDWYIPEVIKYVDPLIWRTLNEKFNYPKFEGYIDLSQYQIEWDRMQNSTELKIKLKKAIASRGNANRTIKEYLERAIELNEYIKRNMEKL